MDEFKVCASQDIFSGEADEFVVNDRNFPCQTLKIRKVSGVVMGL
jgi:hypothetical protein